MIGTIVEPINPSLYAEEFTVTPSTFVASVSYFRELNLLPTLAVFRRILKITKALFSLSSYISIFLYQNNTMAKDVLVRLDYGRYAWVFKRDTRMCIKTHLAT